MSEDHNRRESQLSLMGQANNVKLITLINNNGERKFTFNIETLINLIVYSFFSYFI